MALFIAGIWYYRPMYECKFSCRVAAIQPRWISCARWWLLFIVIITASCGRDRVEQKGAPKDAPPKTVHQALPAQTQAAAGPEQMPVDASTRNPRCSTPLTGAELKHLSVLMLPNKLRLYALEAALEVPAWAAKSSRIEALRDDDLKTHWSCDPKEAGGCAVTLALPETAKVCGIRIFGGIGRSKEEYKRSPRIKKVRLHTPDGYADLTLEDKRDFQHGMFTSCLEIPAITVEVLRAMNLPPSWNISERI
ncbi:MAG: hypothetical protein GY854_28540 [Deltaproteobacteria bacterium]|nr:hypothetical protein [Deltaproteobacteria bacterium]